MSVPPLNYFTDKEGIEKYSNPKIVQRKAKEYGLDVVFSPRKNKKYRIVNPETNEYVDFDFGQGELRENAIAGKVIHIDRFGNIITNLTKEIIFKALNYNKNIMVFIGEKHLKIPFVKSYGYVKNKDVLATIGSSDFFEIGINQGNAAKKLSIKEEDKIEILFG